MSQQEEEDNDNNNKAAERSLIDSILGARDYYEVLGVDDHTAGTATLRRAYLRQCVKAHPDKNSDPRATTAFQKIAHAWQVLSDENARAAYDARGCREEEEYYSSNGDGDTGGSGPQNCYYAPPPPPSRDPSFQEALFMFAAVTSMMGGGATTSTAGDIAQTLYWAEQVLHRSSGDAPRDGAAGNDLQQNARIAMAAGSSLRVASAAARMLGMKQSAAALDQTASMAQMAGVGAMVADAAKDHVPAVKQAIEQGSEKLQQLRGSIAQGGDQLQKLRSSLGAVQNMLRKDDQQQ